MNQPKYLFLLFMVFTSVKVFSQVAASMNGNSKKAIVTVANYNAYPVFATAVQVDAMELYQQLGISGEIPLQAFTKDKQEIIFEKVEKEGRPVLQLYVSLRAYESLVIEIIAAKKKVTGKGINKIKWNNKTHSGSISNGVIRLQYLNDKWDLFLDGPMAGKMGTEVTREVLKNSCYYGWIDSISRGRVSDTRSFKPTLTSEPTHAGPDGKGMISTRLSTIQSSAVTENSRGDIELQFVRHFSGFAKKVVFTETFTLFAAGSTLQYRVNFKNLGNDTMYLAYVGRGGFLYTKYGSGLTNPKLESEKLRNAPLKINSETIRIAWIPQPIWAGINSDAGIGLAITTLQNIPSSVMKGSMVWQFGKDDCDLPLVEHTQGQYPFTIAPGKEVNSGLSFTVTSGGMPLAAVAKAVTTAFNSNRPLVLPSAVSVAFKDGFTQPATVSDRANLKLTNVSGAALNLNFNKPYQLEVYVKTGRGKGDIGYKLIPYDRSLKEVFVPLVAANGKQMVDINAATGWKGFQPFVLQEYRQNASAGLDSLLLVAKPFEKITMLAPVNGAEITDFATYYKWQVCEEAEAYELQMGGDKDFKNSTSVIIQGSNNNYYMPKVLPKAGKHYWRIRAVSSNIKGHWSDLFCFTINSDHSVQPVQRKISPENPLFTIEAPERSDMSKLAGVIPDDLKKYFAIVCDDKLNTAKLLSTAGNSNISFLLRTHHPSPVNGWQALSIVESIFQQFPQVIGIQGGETLGAWYGKGEDALYIKRLIQLCGKYGKIIHEADGCYDENKWREIYIDSSTNSLIRQYRANIIFSQKNNIFNKQLFTQSALFGQYVAGTIENTGAWEDGGWYWAQVGFKKLGQSSGARTGELHDMPPVFWNLTFLMGLARGATVFSMDGQGGVYMRGHYDPTNPKHQNQVLWSSEGEATETFTRFVIPFLRGVVNHGMFVKREDLLKKIRLTVNYQGVEGISKFYEDRYMEFWPLYKGTYGFSTQGVSKGEVYEYFPNTGRYFFIPVLPPATNQLSEKIPSVSIAALQDPEKVTEIFNAAYPPWYEGSALVYQVGDMVAILNRHENDDVADTYSVPLQRGIFTAISGEVQVHSYLMGKFEKNDEQLWLQAHTNYSDRNTMVTIGCTNEPDLKVQPSEALKHSYWDPSKKELQIELLQAKGVVELTISNKNKN